MDSTVLDSSSKEDNLKSWREKLILGLGDFVIANNKEQPLSYRIKENDINSLFYWLITKKK